MAKVNMTGQTQAFTTLEPGKYVAEVVGWEFGFSGNGNDMLTIVLDCCKSKSGSGPKGRIYDRLVFTPNAAWKIEHFVECFAASGGLQVKVGDDIEIDDAAMQRTFMNAKGGVTVTTETYENKARAVIDSYLASKDVGVFPKGDTPRVLTRSQKDSAPAPSSSHSPQSYTSPAEEEDDIPF